MACDGFDAASKTIGSCYITAFDKLLYTALSRIENIFTEDVAVDEAVIKEVSSELLGKCADALPSADDAGIRSVVTEADPRATCI